MQTSEAEETMLNVNTDLMSKTLLTSMFLRLPQHCYFLSSQFDLTLLSSLENDDDDVLFLSSGLFFGLNGGPLAFIMNACALSPTFRLLQM